MGRKRFGVVKTPDIDPTEAIRRQNTELKDINNQLCLMLNMMLRRADGEIVFTPFELNAVLTPGIKDTQTYIDHDKNIVCTWADRPRKVAPVKSELLDKNGQLLT